MIGNPFLGLGQRIVGALEKAFDKLVPPGASPSLGFAGVAGPVGELDALQAPVAAKGVPRDDGKGDSRKAPKKERKDIAPIVACEGGVVQISQYAWNKLAPEYRDRIRNPQNLNEAMLVGTVAQALNQVYRRNAEYINETAARILNYPGVPKLLKQVFDSCQSYDPIALGKELEVHVMPADRISRDDLLAHYQADEASRGVDEAEAPLTIRSDSGAVLRSAPHILVFKSDPSRIVAIGGRQLMTSHGDALFGATPEVVRARRRRIEGNVGDSLLAPLAGVSLTEILNSDELRAVATRSPLLARNLEAFEELMPMLQAAHTVVQNALFGIGLNAEKVECLGLKVDAGGQLLGWCEANINSMPEPLQVDLERLLYSPHDLSPKEQQQIVARLATYRIAHSTINLEVALGPLKEDLAALTALSPADPLYKPELLEAAEAAIAKVISSVPADTANEVRLDRLPDLLSSPMTAFRRAVNLRELEPYREEFLQALEAFKPLFCEGDRFKEGFRGEGIPLSLLSSTLYGADLGVRRFEKESDRRFPALSRNDFYFVREALFYQMVTSDSDRFCTRLSIPRFKEMVLGVIAAHRKANNLDEQYRRWFNEQDRTEGCCPPPKPGEHLTGEIDPEKVSTFAPTVLRGTKIVPAEEFTQVYGIDWAHSISAHDFGYMITSGIQRNWDSKAPLERYLRDAQLCDFGLGEDVLRSIAAYGKQYSSGAWCSELAAALEPYAPNPFIVKPYVPEIESLTKQFVSKHVIERALSVKGFIEAPEVQQSFAPLRAGQEGGGITADDRKLFVEFLSTTFVVGEIRERDGKRELSLHQYTGRQLLGEPNKKVVQIDSPSGGTLEQQVEWFDPSAAMARCRELLGGSVLTTELHTEPLVGAMEIELRPWQSALRVADRSWRELTGHKKAYSVVYDAVRFLQEGTSAGIVTVSSYPQEPLPHWISASSYPARISTNLLQTVHDWVHQDVRIPDGPIGKTGWFEFRDGIPVMTKGRGVAGRALDDVLYSATDASFITNFLRNKFNDSSGELKHLINQMATKKSIIDSRYRDLSVDDRKLVLRRELIVLLRGLGQR